MRFSSLVAVALLIGGCWTPNPPDGAFACNPTGKACPDGYTCIESACWRNGHQPDLAVGEGDVDMTDAVGDDLAPAKKTNGEKCSAGDVCASGFCVDGVCCESACTGQCQACDALTPGVCSTVMGPPHGSRPVCGGAGSLCGGTCDGTSPSACTYPSSQTICGAACDGTCNGAGACSTGGSGTCPNGFACGTNACLTSCSNNTQCQANFMCNAPNCVRIPESDCLDGLDNNGDGLADCADPTCTAQTTCVAAVGAGNEIGLFTTSACPSTNYSMTEHLNQGLQVPATCSGCNCNGVQNCSYAIYFDYSTTTCGSAGYVGTWTSDAGACIAVTPGNPMSIKEVVTATASRCDTIQGTRDATTWASSSNFCAATRSSATCGAGKTCVAQPPGGTACVRIPTPSASCPAGYTTTPKGTWFADTEYTDNRTCACQCAKSGGSCDFLSMSTGPSCPMNNPTGAFIGQTCGKKGDFSFNAWTTIAAIDAYGGGSGANRPTCSISSNATTGGTTASPTGGSTVCCQ
jgi:hypothetical protein